MISRSEYEHNIYVKTNPSDSLIIVIYVDDMLVICNIIDVNLDFKNVLRSQFKMKYLNKAKFILVIKIEKYIK